MSERRTRRPVRRSTSIRKGGRKQDRPTRDPDRFEQPSLSPATRRLLDHFGLAPNRKLGQNFLVDDLVLDQIVQAADLSATDHVVEVGPGLGVLTRALAGRVERLVAVEIDRGMAQALRTLMADTPNVEIVEGDALELDPTSHLPGDYKVVANIPYYITSPLLRRFFECPRPPTRIVVMVQLEVAERIVSEPGDLSLLAVSVQYYGEPRIVGRIPSYAFFPRPKVDSAILRVDVRPSPAVDVPPDPFFKTVAAGFANPRKQIHNALGQRVWLPPGAATEVLGAAGIDPTRRAQTLTLEEWASLARVLVARGAL